MGVKFMIKIKKSKTADTRSCDFSKVTKDQLFESSIQHINDVKLGLEFIKRELTYIASMHDKDKLTDIDHFHSDFITGFKEHGWWDNHKKINRHHLMDVVPTDVNLFDVLEMIVDCVMAGMGRTGKIYPFDLKPDVLLKAFNNTVELLKSQIKVEE